VLLAGLTAAVRSAPTYSIGYAPGVVNPFWPKSLSPEVLGFGAQGRPPGIDPPGFHSQSYKTVPPAFSIAATDCRWICATRTTHPSDPPISSPEMIRPRLWDRHRSAPRDRPTWRCWPPLTGISPTMRSPLAIRPPRGGRPERSESGRPARTRIGPRPPKLGSTYAAGGLTASGEPRPRHCLHGRNSRPGAGDGQSMTQLPAS
jgi:hypothetical protein